MNAAGEINAHQKGDEIYAVLGLDRGAYAERGLGLVVPPTLLATANWVTE